LVLSLARSSDGNIRATMGGVSALGGAWAVVISSGYHPLSEFCWRSSCRCS
jgi:hypothetical protein